MGIISKISRFQSVKVSRLEPPTSPKCRQKWGTHGCLFLKLDRAEFADGPGGRPDLNRLFLDCHYLFDECIFGESLD